jgi:hypothetical protein
MLSTMYTTSMQKFNVKYLVLKKELLDLEVRYFCRGYNTRYFVILIYTQVEQIIDYTTVFF